MRTLLIPLCLSTALLACSSEIDNKPKAKVEDIKKVDPADAKKTDATATRTLRLDAASSSLGFVGAKLTGDHKGSFAAIEGDVVLAGDKPASLRISVKTDSLTSDDEQLTGHLKSPDFFDVAKYPSAAFTATEFTPKASDNSSHEIAGELELHGVKKAIRFPAKLTIDSTTASGQAEFTINRKDFGIVYPGKPDDLIKDDVLLKLNLVFKP